MYFGTHDKSQTEPPAPDIPPPTSNEDPEGYKACRRGRGPDKQYPNPVWKRDDNDRLWREILTTRQYPVIFLTHQ